MASVTKHSGAIIRQARPVKDKPEDCYLTVLEDESEFRYTVEGTPAAAFRPYMGLFVNIEAETRAFVFDNRQVVVIENIRLVPDVKGMEARLKAAGPGINVGSSA